MPKTNKFHQIKYTSNHIKGNLPNQFCAAPFTQMFLYPTGDVYVCCEGGGHLGNVKNSSLEELWNGEKAQALRREFLEGKPKQCKKNIDCKACHLTYTEQLIEADLQPVQTKPPQHLDLIINGKCNIDCIMCEVKNEVRSLVDIPNFHTEIVEKVMPQAKSISVKSGEPFVQKETYWLINKLSEINPDCSVRFTTNGQYNFNDKIKSELSRINVEKIYFSIDSIYKDTFEKVRAQGSLSKLLKSIEDIKAWMKETDRDIELNGNITIQKDNWKDIPETYKYLFDNSIIPHLIPVKKPEIFSLNTLSDADFAEVLFYYLNLGKEYNRFLKKLYFPIVRMAEERSSVLLKKIILMMNARVLEASHQHDKTCTLPFTQLSIFPNGMLRPCCWLTQYDLRKEKDGNLNAAWNDKPMQDVRRQFIPGGKLDICENAVTKTSCNSVHRFPPDFFDIKLDIDRPPQKLHWYFSGACNLECPSCNNWQFKTEFAESEVYWQNLQKDIFPHLCELEVVGGEPFYQKRTFQLIDKMVELNPDCLWYITSNGQFNFHGKIEESLKKIRLSFFSVSIDSLIPEKFNKIRKNGILEKTLKFLDDVIEFKNNLDIKRQFHIRVNFVLQKDNHTELESMLQMAESKAVRLYIIPMIDPFKLSIYDLSYSEKSKILVDVQRLSQLYPQAAINFEEVIADLTAHLKKNKESSQATVAI